MATATPRARSPGKHEAPLMGLTEGEAASRLDRYGPNSLEKERRPSTVATLLRILREPLLLLLVSCGGIYLAIGSPRDGIFLFFSILVIIGITFFQESRSERALHALRELSSPRALVIRDGIERRIPGAEVVVGDVVVLHEGDRVPADGSILSSRYIEIDESILTGESYPVNKSEPGTAVYSGTLVLNGEALMNVSKIGQATSIGQIGNQIASSTKDQSPLQAHFAHLVARATVVSLALSGFLILQYGFLRGDWVEALLSGLAAAISLLPEELPVVLTIFLAMGAWRMTSRKVLTRRLSAIEAMGAITTLCVDKTGTLTTHQMAVKELATLDLSWNIESHQERRFPEPFHPIVEYGMLASHVDAYDPMEKAIRHALEELLTDKDHFHHDWALIREYPLSRRLLALSCVWKSKADRSWIIASKGAPETIAELCHLNPANEKRLLERVEQMARSGLRVLAVAGARWNASELPTNVHDFNFHLIGLMGFEDPVKSSAPAAIRDCYRAGVRVVMITGDYPATALTVARTLGLENPEAVLTGDELTGLSETELERRLAVTNVFARTVPDQKLRIVRALKGAHSVIAMTGDGVNDAPSLKASDVGIAMGGRGTDVAREASDIVLLDDDFSSIVAGIRSGRRILDNIVKAMDYIFAIHVPIAGLAILPISLGLPPLLMPAHIVFLEFIIDPTCTLFFESDPEEPESMQRPPRDLRKPLYGYDRIARAAVQGLAVLIPSFVAYYFAYSNGLAAEAARTVGFASLILGNLGLLVVKRPGGLTESLRKNAVSPWLFTATLGLLLIAIEVPAARVLFRFAPLTPAASLLILGATALAWLLIFGLRMRKAS